MIAISRSGTFLPNIVSENTSLGLGHGTVVEIRTVMYEIRKLPKMNVSLTRKIHIIGLPQGTFLNARWSDEKSETTLCRPSVCGKEAALPITSCAIVFDSLTDHCGNGKSQRNGCRTYRQAQVLRHQHGKKHDPDYEQEMPVDRAEFDAEPQLFGPCTAPCPHGCAAPGHESAKDVQSMHGSQQIEEPGGRAGREKVSGVAELLPYD